MAGLLDFFSGGGSADLYGDMLSERQRGALGNRGLLALAASLGKNAGPSFSPVPDFGAALGMAAGAYGTGSDAAAENVFTAILRAQQAEDLKSKAKARALFTEILSRAGAGGGAAVPATPGTAPQGTANLPSIQGPLAVPAGGGAPRGLGGLLLPEIKSTDLGGDDSGTSRFPDLGIEYPATDPSGLKAGGALRRTQTAATPTVSADLAPYQTGGLLAPQPAELPQLANYAVGNAVPGGASPITGVAPQMGNRLEAMLAGMPPDVLQKFNVISGFRSPERNAQVYAEKGLPPSQNSRHTMGAAVDTTNDPAVLDWVRQNGPQYGVGYTLAGMPGEQNHLEMLGAGGGRPDTVVPSGGGLPVQNAALTGSAREIADNNFGGMRRPGVIATPGQGGFQAFATPAEGLAAISRQIDRYASGATTGKPLTTIREIVSTWAPPSENDTPTLIRRASQVVGVDPDAPLDVSNPAVKAKLIEATIRNEQGGRLPVDPDLINQVASAPAGTATGGPDTVVPAGDRPSLPVQRTQFSGPLQAPGAPGGPERLTPDGKIPGFNLTPAEAARADALAEIAGLGNPFKSILETYYKSPSYLGEAAGATEAGRRAVADPAEIRLKTIQSMLDQSRSWAEKGFQLGPDGKTLVDIPGFIDTQTKMTGADAQAREKARVDAQKQLDQNKAELDRVSKAQEQLGAAGLTPMTVDVLGADGRTQKTQMSQLEFAKRQADKAKRDAAGVPPQPGDVVGTPVFSEFEKGVQAGGVKTLDAQRDAALAASKNIDWNNESLKVLDSGLYTGWDAPLQLQLARIFNIGGKDQREKIQNTEKFLLERGQQVAAQARLLPGPASDKDVAFLTSLALGNITLNEGTIRQMLELYNKYNRRTVDDYNDTMSQVRPDVLPDRLSKVPVAPKLNPMDAETRQNAQNMIARGAKAGPIRNKIRANGMDPEGL